MSNPIELQDLDRLMEYCGVTVQNTSYGINIKAMNGNSIYLTNDLLLELARRAQHAESGEAAMEVDLLACDLDAAALAQDDKRLHGLLVRASLGVKALAAQLDGGQEGSE